MTLVVPRDLTTSVRWRRPRLKLMRRQELSRTAGGEMQSKDLGPALWRASYRSVSLSLDQADAVMADFDSLAGAVHPFYLHPAPRRRPAAASSDAELSGASVTVASIGANNDTLALAGLPASFVMAAGDFLSIETAAGGREFHRLVRGAVADGTGVTDAMAVAPHVRPGVTAGNAVTLLDPLVEMRLVPDSLDDPYEDGRHRAIVFEAIQVIR